MARRAATIPIPNKPSVSYPKLQLARNDTPATLVVCSGRQRARERQANFRVADKSDTDTISRFPGEIHSIAIAA